MEALNEKIKRWEPYTKFKSDPIIEMISSEPEKFLISKKEILQLVIDFGKLRQRFKDLVALYVATELWENLPEDEKQKMRDETKRIEKEFKKVWEK